jgi:hypothetical protein
VKLLHEGTRPVLVASKDETRPHVLSGWLDVEAKHLVVTNGMAIASLPVDLDPRDCTGYIPRAALRLLAKGAVGVARKRWCIFGDRIYRRWQDEKGHPAGKAAVRAQIIPQFIRGDEGTTSISLDPQRLKELACAMGATTVVLTFNPAVRTDPFLVSSADDYAKGDEPDRVLAALMPCRFEMPERKP